MLFGQRNDMSGVPGFGLGQGGPGTPIMAPMQNVAPAATSPFVWGDAGARMTPDEIARRRAIAQVQGKSDYSPVSNWAQGLGRVVDGLLAGMETHKLNKAASANSEHSAAITQALLGGNGDAAAAAMIDPTLSSDVQGLAKMQWERAHPKPVSNDTVNDYQFISQTLGPEAGKQFLQSKANPVQWIQADNGDGTKQLIPMGPSGPLPMGGGGQASTAAPSASAPPAQAILELRSDPSAAAEFDQVFGAGSAARVLGKGGPGAPPPRAGFR